MNCTCRNCWIRVFFALYIINNKNKTHYKNKKRERFPPTQTFSIEKVELLQPFDSNSLAHSALSHRGFQWLLREQVGSVINLALDSFSTWLLPVCPRCWSWFPLNSHLLGNAWCSETADLCPENLTPLETVFCNTYTKTYKALEKRYQNPWEASDLARSSFWQLESKTVHSKKFEEFNQCHRTICVEIVQQEPNLLCKPSPKPQ